MNALEDKKGEDILLLDIHEVSSFADYFVICTGTSDRMLDALSDAALAAARQQHGARGRVEGNAQSGWLLVDFGALVLHLFSPARRDYYQLETLWNQGKVVLRLK